MDLETVKHEAQNVMAYVTAALSGETRVPVPSVLESASVAVAAGLSSPRFPLLIPHVDLSDVALSRALLAVLLAPLIWNFIARFEYYTRILSKLFFRPIIATYALAAWIFFFSLYRDALFAVAMETQERLDELDTPIFHAFAGALAVVGGVLVLASFLRLGVTGTYLGDYFGILMNEQVTGFPFTILEHPMYDGSTMIFLALAILYVSRSLLDGELRPRDRRGVQPSILTIPLLLLHAFDPPVLHETGNAARLESCSARGYTSCTGWHVCLKGLFK